ncbi:hypothetical protein ACQUJV_19940, partial [Ralstonia pseudosolanacearum]
RIRSAVSSNSGGSCRSGANLNWALLEALWPCCRGQVTAGRCDLSVCNAEGGDFKHGLATRKKKAAQSGSAANSGYLGQRYSHQCTRTQPVTRVQHSRYYAFKSVRVFFHTFTFYLFGTLRCRFDVCRTTQLGNAKDHQKEQIKGQVRSTQQSRTARSRPCPKQPVVTLWFRPTAKAT